MEPTTSSFQVELSIQLSYVGWLKKTFKLLSAAALNLDYSIVVW